MVPGIPEGVKIEERELGMARQLIENLTAEFKPEKYRDEYREDLLELIRKKAEGKEIVTAPKRRNVMLWTSWPPSRPACSKPRK